MTDNDPKTPQDLSAFAENLLQALQVKLQAISDQLTHRMDEMGSNIDNLQKDVSELMTEAGIESTDDLH
ncbi:heat shock factor-binding protein 1-like [Ascaphus truei]|uniref:heat shock factor-binding protein 1-like n=1 Tax=Ascaphus truei TaxID=8439 RepID=UPI003F5904F1